MHSRMERYYRANEKSKSELGKRTVKNKDLYESMYDEVEYTNIEAVASIDKTNEIDINKIKEMLRKHEQKEEKPIVKRQIPFIIEEEEDDKNYDVNEMLLRAKENKPDQVQGIRSLKNIDLQTPQRQTKINSSEVVEEELKELIHTITNKKADSDLSLTLLSDLKSSETDTITTDNESIRKIIAAQKEAISKRDAKTEVADKSFYTSGISFSTEDFESLDLEDEKSNYFVKVIVFTGLVILTAAIILGLIMFIR